MIRLVEITIAAVGSNFTGVDEFLPLKGGRESEVFTQSRKVVIRLWKLCRLRYGKTGNENVQLVLRHCCKTSRIAMFRVLPLTNQTWNVVAGLETLLQKNWRVVPLSTNSVYNTYIHTYIHTYFIGSSPRGFSESILHYKIINQVHDNMATWFYSSKDGTAGWCAAFSMQDPEFDPRWHIGRKNGFASNLLCVPSTSFD